MTDDLPPSKAPARRKPIAAARTAAIDAAEKTAQAIEGNPMSVLVGGLAAGVIAGALLPRSEREGELLRPIGTRLREGAAIALKAARDAGTAELASAGLSRLAIREQITRLIDAVGQAATRAGDAASDAATKAAKLETPKPEGAKFENPKAENPKSRKK